LRQFADGRGLARSVHADHENHFRRAVYSFDRPRIRRTQNGEQFFFQQAFQFLHVFDLFAVGFIA